MDPSDGFQRRALSWINDSSDECVCGASGNADIRYSLAICSIISVIPVINCWWSNWPPRGRDKPDMPEHGAEHGKTVFAISSENAIRLASPFNLRLRGPVDLLLRHKPPRCAACHRRCSETR